MVRSRKAILNLFPDPETRATCLSQLSVPSRPSAAADWGVSPAAQPAGTCRYDPRGSGPTRMSSPIHGGATHSAGENTTPPGCSRPPPAQLSPVHCVCAERITGASCRAKPGAKGEDPIYTLPNTGCGGSPGRWRQRGTKNPWQLQKDSAGPSLAL